MYIVYLKLMKERRCYYKTIFEVYFSKSPLFSIVCNLKKFLLSKNWFYLSQRIYNIQSSVIYDIDILHIYSLNVIYIC